ncbi:MAG: DUF167 family protein [Gammaproteobacteria bacterium]
MNTWCHWQDNTLTLRLHLQPGARSDTIVGLHGDALKIRINAPPVDGKANARLRKFLASQFGVSPTQVQVLSGDSHRQKRVAIYAPQRWPAPWFEHLKPC